jgi:hypothetical protein
MKKLFVALLVLALVGATCPLFAQAQEQQQQQPGAKKAGKRTPEERFKAMDKNGDGKITKDEWKGDAAQFDKADANHDSVITLDEFKAARKAPNAGKRGRKRQQQQQP